MREAIVTVGPRAAGKSTFCERVIALDPSIVKVSRDEIAVELFGTDHADPRSGRHTIVREKMIEQVESFLVRENLRMILDTWNSNRHERRSVIRKLREQGFNRVVAWYFTTPADVVEKWFWKKPGVARMSEMSRRKGEGLAFYFEDSPRRDHKAFHCLASDIDSDGFDTVISINPLNVPPARLVGC